MKDRVLAVAGVFGLLATTYVSGLPLLFRADLVSKYLSGGDRGWVGQTVTHVAQAGIVLGIIAWLLREPLAEWGLNLRNAADSLRWVGWFCLAWIPILATVNVVIPLLSGNPPTWTLPQRHIDVAGWIVFQFVIVGITEEIVFRGLVQTHLAKTFSGAIMTIPTAGLLSTAIFCVAHFFPRIHWEQQLFALGFGLFYAIAYHRTGSLLAPMIVHGIGDGTTVVTMWIMRDLMTR